MTALEFYQLKEQPFGVTPDARYLFLTPTQVEALSSLIYGLESGCGFVALVAGPGLGKTTLLYQTLHILREKARMVFLFQTISTPLDLLRALLSGLGVQDLKGSLVEMQIKLKDLLAEQYRDGKRVVLVIDEAQNLDEPVLELVRMLSNFETTTDKLIQIVLAGQPQLGDNIGSPQLLQLRQRLSIIARLQPLTAEETTYYIAHRLRVAGYGGDRPLFTRDALAMIAQGSEGIPRNINNLCFNALSLGCALKQRQIDRDILQQVMADLDIGRLRAKCSQPAPPAAKRVIHAKVDPAYSRSRRAAVAGMKWWPKAAFALSALMVVAALMFMGREWLVRTAAAPPPQAIAAQPVAAQPVAAQLVAAVSEPAVTVAAEQPVPATADTFSGVDSELPGSVLVAPGQTLMSICVEKFGSCSAEVLRQIRELNPSISDLDHIETGQRLWIPRPAP